MKIVLASGSPRRSRILSDMGFEFSIKPAEIDENMLPGETPEDHVLRLSRMKAEKVVGRYPDDLVVGADTAVVLGKDILGKPESTEDAFQMLTFLSGKRHTVFTGLSIVVLSAKISISDYDRTEVEFNDLTSDQIRRYIHSGEPMDKAGSYGIQGMGSFLVKKIDGELDTVIGFPSRLFTKMYEEAVSRLNR